MVKYALEKALNTFIAARKKKLRAKKGLHLIVMIFSFIKNYCISYSSTLGMSFFLAPVCLKEIRKLLINYSITILRSCFTIKFFK